MAGIFTTDRRLTIQFWDQYLEQVTGIKADQARGKSLEEVFPELQTRGLLERFRHVLEEGVVEVLAPSFHRYVISGKLQQEHPNDCQQLVTIAPLRGPASIVGVMTTIEDVTSRSEAEHRDSIQIQHTISELMRTLRREHHDPSVLNDVLRILTTAGWPTFEPLLELLSENEADLRIYAALALGELRDRRAIPYLIGALRDADLNVRYHAIEALAKLRAIEAVDPLLAVAESKEFFLAFPALEALAELGESRIAPRLVSLLDDNTLRPAVVEALGRLGDANVIEPILSVLSKSPELAGVIAQSLVSLKQQYDDFYGEGEYIAELVRRFIRPEHAHHMLAAFNSARGPELRALVQVLGWTGDRSVAEALTRLLASSEVRSEVVETLVRYGSRVTDLLCSQLYSDDEEVRRAAVAALSRIGDPNAVPELVRRLKEDDALIIPISGALAKIGDPRAYEALLNLLRHSHSAVRQAAIGALNSLGHPSLPRDAARLLSDADPHVRESAVRIAGYFGYADCLEALLDRTRDAEESVRRAAVESLAYFSDDRVLEQLRRAIREDTPRVRSAAVQAMGYFEQRTVLTDLLQALEDQDPWVRYYAARALGQLRAVEALDSLAARLRTEPAGSVRIAVAETLGEIGGPRAAAALAPLLSSDDVDVVRTTALALGKIGHPDAAQPLLAMLHSDDAERRIDAVRALAVRRDSRSAEALQWTAAIDSDPRVVSAAIDELVNMDSESAVAALVRLTAQKPIRENVIAALSRLRPSRIESVAAGLDNPQIEVRRSIVEALSRLKHPNASEFLLRALSDDQPAVRIAAIGALNRLGNRLAQKKLAALAHADPDPGVQQAARKAMERQP